MKPAYTYGYGIPQESEVRCTMDRVLSYLDEATPSTTGQDNRIAPGKFRLTSYECGVTYAAMVRASEVTGDASFRNFAH